MSTTLVVNFEVSHITAKNNDDIEKLNNYISHFNSSSAFQCYNFFKLPYHDSLDKRINNISKPHIYNQGGTHITQMIVSSQT